MRNLLVSLFIMTVSNCVLANDAGELKVGGHKLGGIRADIAATSVGVETKTRTDGTEVLKIRGGEAAQSTIWLVKSRIVMIEGKTATIDGNVLHVWQSESLVRHILGSPLESRSFPDSGCLPAHKQLRYIRKTQILKVGLRKKIGRWVVDHITLQQAKPKV